MISAPVTLTGTIVLATALAFWLDRNVPALSKVGASLLAILFGAVLSNTGLVPAASPVYDTIAGPVTSLAIAWLLLSVNIADVRLAGPRMLGAFTLALVGTTVGAFLAALLFAGRLGDSGWRLAGTLTGTYSGGSVNFVAVSRAVELPGSLFAGTVAADNLMTAVWMGATLLLPVWLRRWYPAEVPADTGVSSDDEESQHPFFEAVRISTLDLSLLLGIGFALVAGATWAADWVPRMPAVLWLTTFALLLGHWGPVRRISGGMQLGTLALHFFFVVIGIFSRVEAIVAVGATVFLFTAVVVGVHGLVVYGVGRVLGFDLGTLSVASQAAVGGPSSAIALAAAREWKGLLLPGMVVGLLGYALGNYLGLGVAYAVRGMLGF